MVRFRFANHYPIWNANRMIYHIPPFFIKEPLQHKRENCQLGNKLWEVPEQLQAVISNRFDA